jgi:hypothetical protein
VELVELLEPLELDDPLEIAPPELEPLGEGAATAAVATEIVAAVGEPKFAAPATDVSEMLKFLPAAAAETGT